MSKAKHYEIHLTRKQVFFTVAAFIVCFLLAFSLGTITGIKYFTDKTPSPLSSPLQDEYPSPSLASLGTLESRTVSNPEGNKVIHEFTFYDTLPNNGDTPVPLTPPEVTTKREEKSSPPKKTAPVNREKSKGGSPQQYVIQFGSFQQEEKAYALAQKLSKQGYLAHVTVNTIGEKRWHRVRMGPFNTQDDAQSWASRLPPITPPPFITSLKD